VTTGLSRAAFLRRGAVGGGALLVGGSGVLALSDVAGAATPPDFDLAYVRLLIAAELLALDFQATALATRKLHHPSATSVIRRMRADEKAHYDLLAAVLASAGQTPATASDIDFSYPKGSFRSHASILALGTRLERVMIAAYLGAVEAVATPKLRLSIGKIAANEAQHESALAALAGRPVIGKPFGPELDMASVSDVLDEFES